MFYAPFCKPATVVCFGAYPVFPMPCALLVLPSFAPTSQEPTTSDFAVCWPLAWGHSVKQEIEKLWSNKLIIWVKNNMGTCSLHSWKMYEQLWTCISSASSFDYKQSMRWLSVFAARFYCSQHRILAFWKCLLVSSSFYFCSRGSTWLSPVVLLEFEVHRVTPSNPRYLHWRRGKFHVHLHAALPTNVAPTISTKG